MNINFKQIGIIGGALAPILALAVWFTNSLVWQGEYKRHLVSRTTEIQQFKAVYNRGQLDTQIKLTAILMYQHESKIEGGFTLSPRQQSEYERLKAEIIELERQKNAAMGIN